jgi:hypothetical protein
MALRSQFRKIRRHLVDGMSVGAVRFWAMWNDQMYLYTREQFRAMGEHLDAGETVEAGLMKFQIEYEEGV